LVVSITQGKRRGGKGKEKGGGDFLTPRPDSRGKHESAKLTGSKEERKKEGKTAIMPLAEKKSIGEKRGRRDGIDQGESSRR